MDKTRVEAFSDGVIAVAITLLVIDLHVPDPAGSGSLADRLGDQWPSYVAYAVSFLTIGVIWINHHAMFRRVIGVDHSILILNVLLLMCVVVLPFTTSLMAEYLTAALGQHVAALIYGGSFLLMALLFVIMQRHLMVNRRHLLDPRMTEPIRRWVLRRNAAGIVPYALATVGGILSQYFTLAVCGLIALFYALPSTTADAEGAPTAGTDIADATGDL